MRYSILLLGLLSCSANALADWQAKVVRDPISEFSQFSIQASDGFPIFTLSCASVNGLPTDMLQIDRLTLFQIDVIERIEIQVDNNATMIFFPSQHNINTAYTYHPQLESGIETVTLIPSGDSGGIQFVELVRQFIEGFSAVVWVKTASKDTQVEFSLLGFTNSYLSMRTACLDYGNNRLQSSN